jgi:hypothetical protein
MRRGARMSTLVHMLRFSPLRGGLRRPKADQLQPGTYVTDGERLFCVLSQFASEDEIELATLEDCLTLEVKPYCSDELEDLRLRHVQAVAAA